jgi:protein tyrosine/serine phosphatase
MMIQRNKLARHKAAWIVAELFVATIAFAFAFTTIAARQTTQIAPADRITLPGLSNGAHVSGTVYRGAQPHVETIPGLKKLGITVVVDFRDGNDNILWEKRLVESEGMVFVSIPWSARSGPSRETVMAFFGTLRDNSGKNIFVHCERGADRTGTMIALYRITYDHWTPAQAVAEMNAFHYWNHIFPHLARYVEAFPVTLANDPSLAEKTVPATPR